MILGNLRTSERVVGLHPRFKALFDYILTHDLLDAPTGIIEVDGKEIFINNQSLDKAHKQPLEVHNKYIDIQVLLSGTERIGLRHRDDIGTYYQPYDEAKDVAFSDEEPEWFVDLRPGDFVILWPEDGHAPAMGEGPIRKFIAKILL